MKLTDTNVKVHEILTFHSHGYIRYIRYMHVYLFGQHFFFFKSFRLYKWNGFEWVNRYDSNRNSDVMVMKFSAAGLQSIFLSSATLNKLQLIICSVVAVVSFCYIVVIVVIHEMTLYQLLKRSMDIICWTMRLACPCQKVFHILIIFNSFD